MGRAFEYRKATKLKRWGHMAKTFTKIGKEITIAVKACTIMKLFFLKVTTEAKKYRALAADRFWKNSNGYTQPNTGFC